MTKELTLDEKIDLVKTMFKGQDLGQKSIDIFIEALKNNADDVSELDILTQLIYKTILEYKTVEDIFFVFNYQKSQLAKIQKEIAKTSPELDIYYNGY